MAVVALTLAMLAPGTSVLAQQGGAECAAIPADAERLACYDGLFRAGAPVAAVPDGEAVVLQSEQLIPARPTGRGNATMIIACEPEGLTIRFAFAGNVLSATGSNTGISLQRDLLRAEARTLPPSSNGTELIMSGDAEVRAFLDSLLGVTNLGARVTPANARSLNVRFRVTELETQVAPVLAACQ